VRVAVVHHWFVSQGGGERVAEALAQMYPSADLFALVANPEMMPQSLRDRSLRTSILNRIPFANRIYRQLLPLYPLAVEQIDLSAYDLILTSDSGPMKGTIISPSGVHICYCHSPMRYLWDQYHEYRRSMGRISRAAFSLSAQYVRTWDQRAAQHVTEFAANSCYVASRIRRYYGRESTVIYPPVDTSSGYLVDAPGDAYLTVGRLVPYKRVDLLIQACNRLGRELRIIGTGPEEARLRAQAGNTIKFLGNVDDETLWEEYAHCRAFLFAAEEDFGMAVVEAQACGRPIIGLGKGGVLETVLSLDSTAPCSQDTGVLFYQQTAMAVSEAILRFEAGEHHFQPHYVRQRACRFSAEAFRRSFQNLVDRALKAPSRVREVEVCL
jgi:glycosyltransferase involved in cell wall biosynthesis